MIRCQEVFVKFRNNQNAQRVSLADGGTFCKTIEIDEGPTALRLIFRDGENRIRKLIGIPMDVVLEYTCDNVDSPPVPAHLKGLTPNT